MDSHQNLMLQNLDSYHATNQRLKNIRKQWNIFETSIQYCMNEENLQGITHTRKDIKKSLNKILAILCEEDLENDKDRTIGECLEYFMEHNIFEILGAYTKADKPNGFFKIGCPIITEIIV